MTHKAELHTVRLNAVLAWPNLNPRRDFNKEGLDELAASIKDKGLLNPVSVAPAGLKKNGVHYWLYAGERRLRACKLAGVKMIDVLVRDVDEATAHHLAGIENLDRDDLTAIEEATWLQRELELTGQTQQELGDTLGRSQAWIANRVRLLALPKPIQTMIHKGTIAPAMARDTLLRFTKLGKADQATLWKEITAAIKREAKEESPVVLEALRSATYHAVREAGAVLVSDGYHYDAARGASYTVKPAAFKKFKAEHGARCFAASHSAYNQSEAEYTLAVTEWGAVAEKAIEETSNSGSAGGVSKEVLEDPKLSPTAEPVDYYELQRKFGHENILPFSEIVDPSKIDPSHVAPTTNKGLAYVGPNVRALKGARTRAKTPVRKEVAQKVQSGRMDKGGKLSPAQVFAGLLEAVVETNYSSTLKGMIEAELGREVELSRYHVGVEQIADLKIPAKALKRIAAGVAHVAAGKAHYWDLDGKIDKAVDARVTRDTAKARKAWVGKHAPTPTTQIGPQKKGGK